mgnify:CR=1 FL=1
MTGRVVEIAEEARHLARFRGFLVVSDGDDELGRVPLDDIDAIVVTARGASYSNALVAECARRGIPLVVCGENFAPLAWLWPIEGHHTPNLRLRQQLDAGRALKKALWKQIVQAKIRQQAAVLDAVGEDAAPLRDFPRKVRAGDPDNIEAQAARRYWPLMMGPDFRRDTGGGGVNGMLNYGYAVLRSTVARAVLANGLHPTAAIFHSNRGNAFALVDDLMEPFRPFVDVVARKLSDSGVSEVTRDAKAALARILLMDMETDAGVTPLKTAALRAARSLADCYAGEATGLSLPPPQSPLFLSGGQDHG